MSRPIASTSSLSNWLIGKPSQLASTGVRSSSPESDRTTPHGCRAMWRGQAVEPLDDVEHQLEPRHVEPARPQLGQLGEGVADVAGGDVRERLGHRVDLVWRQAEGRTGVADRVTHAVGVHHRHARDPFAAEVVEDPLVDLGAARRLDVDVDVGQLGPQR